MFFQTAVLFSTLIATGLCETGLLSSSSTYESSPSSYYRQGRQVGFGYPYSNSYSYQNPSFGFGNGGGYSNNFGYNQQGWTPSYYQTGYNYNRYPSYYSNYNYPRYNNYQSGYNNGGGFGSGYPYQSSYGIVPQPVRGGYAK